MPKITTSQGLIISFEDMGPRDAPPIILIMGLGAQLTIWPDELCRGLVDKGYRVIRFDNRDAGLSSQLDEYGEPSLIKAWLSQRLDKISGIPYKLEDMAGDVMELMAALKIKKAHLVGASMGGMIAHIIAAKHKKKVLSLTSIMSTTSHPNLPNANLKVLLKLAKRPNRFSREAAIRYTVKMNRLIGSPAYPVDELTLRQQASQSYDRAYNPSGFKRQLVAITATGDRSHLMAKIKAPTLVIHGSDDPIIPVEAGLDTASKIRKAKMKVVKGMGHDFPPSLMPKMTKWIARHVKKTERKRLLKSQVEGLAAAPETLTKELNSQKINAQADCNQKTA